MDSEIPLKNKLIQIVGEAVSGGVIDKDEADMILNVMSFGNTDAADIMIHRNDVTAFRDEETLRDCADAMLSGPYSRYPVYSDDLDNITGIIHLKDVLKYYMSHRDESERPIGKIYGLIRKPAFIQETRSIDNIFRYMRQNKVHMVIVVDEYGQTSGIITMEDIIEEIVGNILDEYDSDENYVERGFNYLIMDGMTPLEEAEKELHIEISDDRYETLNGYITSLLDHVPGNDDKEVYDDSYIYKILNVRNNTVGKVRVEKLKKKNTDRKEN